MERVCFTVMSVVYCMALGCGHGATPAASREGAEAAATPGSESSSDHHTSAIPLSVQQPGLRPREAAPAVAAPPARPRGAPRDGRAMEAVDPWEPLSESYPVYGVAFHYLAQVFAAPQKGAPVLGYMRRGAQFRAREAEGDTSCEAGWHEVVGAGYVCRGKGFVLGDSPRAWDPSPEPAEVDAAMPYPYARVMSDMLQYWRIPDVPEEQHAKGVLEQWKKPAPGAKAPAAGAQTQAMLPSAPLTTPLASTGKTASTAMPDIVRLAMRPGFYVSVDGEEEHSERRWTRTVRGGYLRSERLNPVKDSALRGSTFEGNQPVAFVYRPRAQRFRRDPLNGQLTPAGDLPVYTSLRLAQPTAELAREGYVVTTEGDWIRSTSLRIAERIPRPKRVPSGAKWIHVKLDSQTLVAYEGERPVFVTLVASGRPGFATPRGLFHVESKHVATTMDDLASGDDAYSIEDVPWTMYFDRGYALHGAFWHDKFGQVRSHGCVNLSPADARWLFAWSTPELPSGWHGVYRGRREGTYIWID